jgi:hypothetical protein
MMPAAGKYWIAAERPFVTVAPGVNQVLPGIADAEAVTSTTDLTMLSKKNK